jgi:hypothetical protein
MSSSGGTLSQRPAWDFVLLHASGELMKYIAARPKFRTARNKLFALVPSNCLETFRPYLTHLCDQRLSKIVSERKVQNLFQDRPQQQRIQQDQDDSAVMDGRGGIADRTTVMRKRSPSTARESSGPRKKRRTSIYLHSSSRLQISRSNLSTHSSGKSGRSIKERVGRALQVPTHDDDAVAEGAMLAHDEYYQLLTQYDIDCRERWSNKLVEPVLGEWNAFVACTQEEQQKSWTSFQRRLHFLYYNHMVDEEKALSRNIDMVLANVHDNSQGDHHDGDRVQKYVSLVDRYHGRQKERLNVFVKRLEGDVNTLLAQSMEFQLAGWRDALEDQRERWEEFRNCERSSVDLHVTGCARALGSTNY